MLGYPYFKENYRMIVVDLSKQQVLDVDPKTTQQINFTGNLGQIGNTTMFLTLEEVKKTILFFYRNSKSIMNFS